MIKTALDDISYIGGLLIGLLIIVCIVGYALGYWALNHSETLKEKRAAQERDYNEFMENEDH